jgi:tetratricopeptide (TPR) repeat protein
MSLHHLSGAETFEMAKGMLGTDQFPEALMGALTEKAEGVPLFVEEVTKTLIDLGFLVRQNGGYQMAKALDEVGVPGTMQDIIMARLDRLGVDGKRVVQLASVIGRQFMAKLLERVAGLTGRLEGLLRELQTLEIVYEQGLGPEPAYIFKHAVIQDVAYNSLLIRRRKELHRAVGEAIEELYRERLSEHYAELAHHFERGEEWSKAIHYNTLAGDQASHSFSNREAEDHYSRALEVASRLPLAEPGLVADLHAKRGAVLNTVGRHEEAIAEYERAREIATSAKDDSRKCRALLGLVDVYYNAHRRQPVRDCADEALKLAREIGDTRLEASCLASRILPVGSWEGPTQEVMEDAKEAVRLAQVVEDPRLLAAANVGLGGVLQWRAEFGRGLEHLRKGIELAQSTHDGWALGMGLFHMGHLRLSQGDYEEALRVYGQMRDYAQGAEHRFFLARVPNLFGAVHLELYDLERALTLNLEGEEAARRFNPGQNPWLTRSSKWDSSIWSAAITTSLRNSFSAPGTYCKVTSLRGGAGTSRCSAPAASSPSHAVITMRLGASLTSPSTWRPSASRASTLRVRSDCREKCSWPRERFPTRPAFSRARSPWPRSSRPHPIYGNAALRSERYCSSWSRARLITCSTT